MNWYLISQISEDQKKWQRFPPRRQREFPFMHDPGYNRKAAPYLGNETPDGYDIDYNLYHVTTNLSGVVSSGRLKSRLELGGTVGLGGGWKNEASYMVSTTYSYDKARSIYSDIKLISEIVSGSVPAHTIFNSFDFDDEYDNGKVASVLEEWLSHKDVTDYLSGQKDENEFGFLLDKSIVSGEQAYLLWQKLEEAKAESQIDILDNSTDFVDLGITGFTGSYEDMKKINPSQVAILQLAARKNAKPEHIPLELELRFKPEDLRVVRYLQP